ncbi:pyridine nucleotide disulphide reductase class-i signature [Lucifera butyrica]|uniref:Dihydrolipoyl dehydrogenase n=1 Tax=Lucifera butyrica TaxID=1351585 RepID=A0A498R6J7_9FIRM|nr:dihydrolipoyl dehydrogenase [Lucifera butyrica]VBB08346.1 pyridine nucleotide disulphide reductase class-i signature [Lucifera butyrica]
MTYDVAILGGGPGGYVAAIRVAQLGGKAILVEKEQLGGVCLNRGCIPTKTLLNSAEKWRDLQHCQEFGLQAGSIGFDFSQIQARKERVVTQLRGGIEQLVKSHGIEVMFGRATLTGANTLTVNGRSGTERIEARNLIIATGSLPQALPVAGAGLPGVLTSDDILNLPGVPRSLAVIGAGAVGLEFAAVYQAFGAEVTVVEMQPSILPAVDGDLVKRMALILRKQGLKLLNGTKVVSVAAEENGLTLTLDNGRGLQELTVEKVLVATGRRPNCSELGLATAGVHFADRGIPVNDRMETNKKGIYAIGDVTGRFMWAHAASAAGIVAAENAMGQMSVLDFRAMPGCIFITPEIAMVGLREEEARQQGYDILVSRFPFAANGKAVSMGQADGLVKVIAAAGDNKILGMHILGPHASDLIMEGALAIRNGLTAREIAHTIHPHPSLSETVMETAHGIDGDIIHQLRLQRRQ